MWRPELSKSNCRWTQTAAIEIDLRSVIVSPLSPPESDEKDAGQSPFKAGSLQVSGYGEQLVSINQTLRSLVRFPYAHHLTSETERLLPFLALVLELRCLVGLRP